MATTTNFGWETPDDTDLVKDGALAIRTLGSAIDTSLVDLKGGTTGQVLSKTSNTDMDFTWVTSDDANAIQNTIVDAKGDLISASAADVPARLAVGNNGETLVADSSATTGLRYNPPVGSLANPVINGGMDIWQRGTSIASTSGTSIIYTADRWNYQNSASGVSATVSRQTTGDTTNLPNIQYCLRVHRTAGNTNTNPLYLCQSIETVNSIPFAGKTVTLSFYARKGANYSSTGDALNIIFAQGTGTDENRLSGYTGGSNVLTGTATLTTTWQRFTFTGTVATNTTELAIFPYYAGTGTAGANDYFEITGVQIDVGTWTASTAPTFRRSGGTLAGELAACQRYYQLIASGNTKNICNVAAYNATSVYGTYFTKVSMRTAPTISVVTGTDYYSVAGNNGSDGTTTVALALASENQVRLEVTSGIAVTQGYAYWLDTTNASAFLAVQAEL